MPTTHYFSTKQLKVYYIFIFNSKNRDTLCFVDPLVSRDPAKD